MTARAPSPPEPLSPDHALDGFECGEASLDDWLKRQALKNQAAGQQHGLPSSQMTSVFAVCDPNN
jgi:hypothetical protein